MASFGGDPLREVAFTVTFALINATVPAPTERPPTMLALTELANTAAYHFDKRLPLPSVRFRPPPPFRPPACAVAA